jgi:predicted transcriptional regulator of viral defense system
MPGLDDFFDDIHGESHPLDRLLANLAARQHGVVARRQLLKLGFGEGAIDHRLLTGRLHAVHQGIHAVGHTALTREGFLMAAVLACGEGAVLSHRNAAELWGVGSAARSDIDVTTVSRGRKPRRGIAPHQVRRLHRADRTIRDGIPVTTLARTFLDNAEVLNRRQLERQLENAERQGLFDRRPPNCRC